jgi:hypothetical protein
LIATTEGATLWNTWSIAGTPAEEGSPAAAETKRVTRYAAISHTIHHPTLDVLSIRPSRSTMTTGETLESFCRASYWQKYQFCDWKTYREFGRS